MNKSPDAFRSIGEVSRLVGVAPHVLRYWETQFSQLSPVKRADGRRYYRPDDVRLAAGLCQVLREEGLSIRGAKRLISADRGAGLRKIGMARLDENLGETAEAAQEPRAPAVRLAVPATPPPETVDKTTGGGAQPRAPDPAPAAPRRRPAAGALPLFPEIDRAPRAEWLTRLVATAAALRLREMQGKPLQPRAKKLRDSLNGAR
ncbi:DNA-binding transcriptional regulator, MerR family [Paracoccus halophilus]|uniref:DNA-binding transcriptional regulator, MerR family n=1 Tax=Paracoccus halophilus TaxID=376733 RepID=A0A099F3T4_9RHOB|nr:MerR family transcriptional regulator [Paracoccus halophilus]KGJ04943.1 MerR family transcriptional regulator [Paracoccus halophilus]SFA39284.1 DNA-binding transcriptional regulator, MerR family [Paracoccus halophilus]